MQSRSLASTFALLVCSFVLMCSSTRAAPLFALTETNKLVRIETTALQHIQSHTNVVGLQAGEKLLAIDVRPATGQLYGITNESRLYVINPNTGTATQVGMGAFSPALNLGNVRGWSIDLGFDFDPVTDRIRVVTGTGQNLRLDPDSASVVADTALSFAAGDVNAGRSAHVSAAAYTNNFAGASSTTLYTLINGTGGGPESTVLTTLGSLGGNPVSPNSGQLFTVGNVGIVFIEPTGLDVAPDGTAYALLSSTDTRNRIFTINLTNGNANQLGTVGPELLRDIAAVLPNSPAPVGTFQFDAISYTANENDPFVTLNVTRTGNTSVAATIELSTTDDSAKQKSDYIIVRRKLRFGVGETNRSVKVLLVDDAFLDPAETFNAFLSDAAGGFLPGTPGSASIVIMDNDSSTLPPNQNPHLNPEFFVRQHYADFLNREPDLAGQDFWVNQITSCGSNQQCIDARRINVSAAFFLSIEFQETGVLAYLAEKAAFGGLPAYGQFMGDVQALQQDFVFGSPGAQAQLEVNKQLFFDEFVKRSEFETKYSALSNAAYIDAVLANSGNANSSSRLFITRLTGSQVVPAQGTAAKGLSVLRIGSNPNNAWISLSFNDLSSTQTSAHIHGPATVSSNAPSLFNLPVGQFTAFAVTLSTQQSSDLRNGLLYVDVHTQSGPDGEIRGQFPSEKSLRDALVLALDDGIISRAQALRLIAEDQQFKQLEFNSAFVLMEYFGYLRRGPSDPPDNNLAGFNFWLNKLNLFNGNFISAEMVKAFISSTEYRSRFGSP